MDFNRWPKLCFNALFTVSENGNNLNWKWLKSINNILTDNNMDFMFTTHLDNNKELFDTLKHTQDERLSRLWYEDACQKSSLMNYVQFKKHPALESYLLDKLDFYGASLKFKARSNTLPLDRKISTWDTNISGICSLCNDGVEDIMHFLLKCRTLNDIRDVEMSSLKETLCNNGYSTIWNIFICSEPHIQLRFVLGSNIFHFMHLFPQEAYNDIDIIFDKYCKTFLKKAWSIRTNIKNSNS